MGQLSPVIRIPAGFVVMKVVDIRYPENPAARAEAQKRALDQQRGAAMAAHEQALRRNNAVVNTAVLKSIDYEAAKPGIDALLKDKRVVAEIKGAAPVTVGGPHRLPAPAVVPRDRPGRAAQAHERPEGGRPRSHAGAAAAEHAEALRLGIDKTDAYRDRVNGFTRVARLRQRSCRR